MRIIIDQFFMIKLFLTAINTINRGYETYPAPWKPLYFYGYSPMTSSLNFVVNSDNFLFALLCKPRYLWVLSFFPR